jgi:dihydrofolate reductase
LDAARVRIGGGWSERVGTVPDTDPTSGPACRVISSAGNRAALMEGPLDWPNATVARGDAVDVVARLKEESEAPLRSPGSLSMNRALMAAGLVDRVQVTLFPVMTGQTGLHPIFQDAADFDLELIERRTLDAHTQELIYRPTLHG